MLVIVLCRFSVSFVKLFVNLKLNFSLQDPSRKWWATASKYLAAFSANNYYYSKFGKTLTKVIASCFSRKIVVNFYPEIFLAQSNFPTSKTKASRMDCSRVCPPVATHLAKRLLSSVREQEVANSTIARNFALLRQRSPLPN